MSRPTAGVLSVSKGIRLLLAFALATLSMLAWSVLRPTPAYAADDQIESFDIRYMMNPSGVLSVTETIVWRFGDDSGRHGIERYFITREPYDEQQDAVYGIDNISVASPDPGVATQYSERDDEAKDGREVQKRIRIGDPDETISAPTATYVITYEVTGRDADVPRVRRVLLGRHRVREPADPAGDGDCGGAGRGPGRDLLRRSAAEQDTCDQVDFSPGGSASFGQANVAPGAGISIGVKITSGLVADNAPHLEPDGSKLTSGERAGLIGLAAAFGAVLIGSPLVGMLWWRKNGRDQRYAGLAPGTVPLAGQTAEIVAHDPDIAIPVAFTPPRIPVAEAGLLVDGQVDTRETAATIIDLAVRGALTVESTGEDDFRVTLVDPDRAAAPHEMVLLTALFDGQPPGATKDLLVPGEPGHRPHQDARLGA